MSRRRIIRWVKGWFRGGFGPCLRATLTFHLTLDVMAVIALASAVAGGLIRLTETLPLVLAGGVGKTALSGFEAYWKCRSFDRLQRRQDQGDVYG